MRDVGTHTNIEMSGWTRAANSVVFYGLLTITAFYALPNQNSALTKTFLGVAVSLLTIIYITVASAAGRFQSMRSRLLIPLAGILVLAMLQWSALFGDALTSWDRQETLIFIIVISALIMFGNSLAGSELRGSYGRVLVVFVIALGLGSSFFGLLRDLVPSMIPSYISARLSPGEGFAQFANQNHFMLLVEMTMGLLIGVLVRGRHSWAIKVPATAAVGFLIYTAIQVNSRGGLITLAAMMIFAVFMYIAVRRPSGGSGVGRPYFKQALIGIGISALIFSFIVFSIAYIGGERSVMRFENLDREITVSEGRGNRAAIWSSTLDLIKEHPLTGVGWGAYSVAIPYYDISAGAYELEQAHNEYLETLASGGIIGLILLLMLIGIVANESRANLMSRDEHIATTAFGAMTGIFGVALHSFVDFGLHIILNALVLTILIVLATRKSDEPPTDRTPQNKYPSNRESFGVAVYALWTFSILILAGWQFAVYYQSRAAERNNSLSNAMRAIKLSGSNPDAHIARARIFQRVSDFPAAADALQKAIELRPKDFSLWLLLGVYHQRANNIPAAEAAFREAITLAPRYSLPWYQMGTMLLKHGEIEEGFQSLSVAVELEPRHYPESVELAARYWPGDPVAIQKAAKPTTPDAWKTLSQKFIANSWMTPEVESFLTGGELSASEKAVISTQLVEKRNFALAHRVWATTQQDSDQALIINGDFETLDSFRSRTFGWNVDRKITGVTFTQNADSAHTGSHSLRIDLAGEVETNRQLLTQLVYIPEPGQYELIFAYRTEELVSAAMPAVMVIDAANRGVLGAPVVLGKTGHDWSKASIGFELNSPAVYITFQRERCGMTPCPIFGTVFLDSFELKSK
jgi:O-antigen ligase